MGKYSIVIGKSAQKELQAHYKAGNKLSIKRIEKIISELSDHPEIGIGNPERLKFDLSGYWSRRINRKDRLVYKIEDHIITVTIITTMGHYEDK